MPETSAAGAPGGAAEITAETVQHLAGLARIALTDAEVASLTSELGSILTSIAKVSEVASDEVPATSHPIPINNVMRRDVVADVLSQDEALANAPEAADGMFRVSSILGDEQ
ncbi:MAG: Asp-tRNA(Asn)/Glu-tRNA(Gln) amidotransferase subunit GatC [Leucobacter sp.]|nr:Asp-tRNA(Asn)/Glu-tRNA(Gln) amidotransferase subunit GatC [Leucobacter sp.]